MTKKSVNSKINVNHLANLSSLSLTPQQTKDLQNKLASTLDYVDSVQSLETSDISETNQVTGLTNVFREDKIEPDRVLTQKQALSGAKNTHKGYFVVDILVEN